jgi:P27 family predicted phage terminase small subunit
MGRPRRPTVLKLIDGTIRPADANPNEPRVPPGVPEAPAYLSKNERAAWDRFVEVLSKMRVLTTADFAALEQLACAFAEAKELRAFIRKNGRVYEMFTEHGAKMRRPHPELTLLAKADRQVINLLGRFGLTPSDRSNVVATPDRHSDPDDEFQ